MKLRAIIHADESGGYWAEVPALPGCVTQGETIDEVHANLREAMRGVLPEKVRTRTGKGGMDARIFWSLQHEAPLIRMLTTNPMLGQLGCINVDELSRMVDAARKGEYRHTVHLFSVLALETWLRARFDTWQAPQARQTAA